MLFMYSNKQAPMDWIVAESHHNFVQKSKLLFSNSLTIFGTEIKEISVKMLTTKYAACPKFQYFLLFLWCNFTVI
jgi:hypothetical protein